MDRLNARAQPDIMVTVSPGANTPVTPVSVQSFEYQRILPHVKHVGTFELYHHRRRAQLNGFDDALFVDSTGHISEGSTWNIGFFDGRRLIWPRAALLVGITMQLIQARLEARGVEVETPHSSRRRRVVPFGLFDELNYALPSHSTHQRHERTH